MTKEQLRLERECLGYSMAALERRLGLTEGKLYRIERGHDAMPEFLRTMDRLAIEPAGPPLPHRPFKPNPWLDTPREDLETHEIARVPVFSWDGTVKGRVTERAGASEARRISGWHSCWGEMNGVQGWIPVGYKPPK